MVEMPTAIRGKLPPVTRVIGLDTEAEFLYVTTATKDTTAKKKDAHAKKDTSVARPKSDVLALDLGSARVDTVASGIEQATLGPDGTLYTVDAKRRVVTLARRVRVAWPQPLPGVPLQLFGAADQRLVVADPPALITAAADQPPTSRPLPAGSDVERLTQRVVELERRLRDLSAALDGDRPGPVPSKKAGGETRGRTGGRRRPAEPGQA